MLSSTDTLAAWTAEAGRLLESGAGASAMADFVAQSPQSVRLTRPFGAVAGRTLGRLVALDCLGALDFRGAPDTPDTPGIPGARSAPDTTDARSSHGSQGSPDAGCPDAGRPDAGLVNPLDRFGSNVSRWTVFAPDACAYLLACTPPDLIATMLFAWPARWLPLRVFFAAALQGLIAEGHPGTAELAADDDLVKTLRMMTGWSGQTLALPADFSLPDWLAPLRPARTAATDTLTAAWTLEAGRLVRAGASVPELAAHVLTSPEAVRMTLPFGAVAGRILGRLVALDARFPDGRWSLPLYRYCGSCDFLDSWTVFAPPVCAQLLAGLDPEILMTALTVWPARRLHSRAFFAAALLGLVEERHPGTEYLAEHEGLRALLVEMCLGRGPALEFAEDELGPDHMHQDRPDPDRLHQDRPSPDGLHPYREPADTNPDGGPDDDNGSPAGRPAADAGDTVEKPGDAAAEPGSDPDAAPAAAPDAKPDSGPGSGSRGAPAGGAAGDRAAAPHTAETPPDIPTAKTHRKPARGAAGAGEAA